MADLHIDDFYQDVTGLPLEQMFDSSLPASVARQRVTMAQQLRDARASGSSIRLAETAHLCFIRQPT